MADTLKRNIIVINLDPAAEIFKYRCDIGKIKNIKKKISEI
jgi:hypothetical protein